MENNSPSRPRRWFVSAALWSMPGLLLMALGTGVRSYAPVLAMLSERGVVGIRGEVAEDVIRRVLIRDFRIIADPSASTFEVSFETTHTLWLACTDPEAEPGLASGREPHPRAAVVVATRRPRSVRRQAATLRVS